MRVVAGRYGSRPLKPVPGLNTRPTTDKIKEAIFSSLGGFFDGGLCLDFYGGSGALAIEAVSRGIDRAVLTEKYRPALKTIEQNIAMTKEEDRFTVLAGDNRKSLQSLKVSEADLVFDLVLLDPPYAKQKLVEDMEWLLAQGLIGPETTIVCETDDVTDLPEVIAGYQRYQHKRYGQTQIHFYGMPEAD